MCIRCVFVPVIVGALTVSCSARGSETDSDATPVAVNAENLSAEEMSKLWRRAIDIGQDTRCPDWPDLSRSGFDTVLRFCRARNRKDCMAFLCRQFGRHGAVGDFILMYAMLQCRLLPHHAADVEVMRQQPTWLFESRMAAAERMVRIISTDRKLRRRFYQAIVWTRRYFDDDIFYPMTLGRSLRLLLENELREGEDPKYWWRSYDVILAIEATGNGELLNDADPERLIGVVRTWHEWLKENGPYLRALPTSWYWVLDEGEKRRQEGYVPFLRNPPSFVALAVFPEVPFSDWPEELRLPKPGFLIE